MPQLRTFRNYCATLLALALASLGGGIEDALTLATIDEPMITMAIAPRISLIDDPERRHEEVRRVAESAPPYLLPSILQVAARQDAAAQPLGAGGGGRGVFTELAAELGLGHHDSLESQTELAVDAFIAGLASQGAVVRRRADIESLRRKYQDHIDGGLVDPGQAREGARMLARLFDEWPPIGAGIDEVAGAVGVAPRDRGQGRYDYVFTEPFGAIIWTLEVRDGKVHMVHTSKGA